MPTNKRYHVEEATMPVYSTKLIIDKAENQHLKYMNDIMELLNIYEDAIRDLRDVLQALYDVQNGPPLVREAESWKAVMDEAEKMLAKYNDTVSNDLTPEQQNVKDREGTDE
jgi:hypothetical protein